MKLKEDLEKLINSKETGMKYLEEVTSLLPELQSFMVCVLEAQETENQPLIQYLIGIIKDTTAGVENQDEILLRDVLEYGWYSLIMDIIGEDISEYV